MKISRRVEVSLLANLPWTAMRTAPFFGCENTRVAVTAFERLPEHVVAKDTPQGDDVGFVARFGGGVDLYATENILVSLEAVYALSAGGAGAGPETEILGETEFMGEKLRLPLEDLSHVSVSLGAAYRF